MNHTFRLFSLLLACIAVSPACGPQLKLPSDPLQLTVPQRSIEPIPGSDGRLRIAVDDITEGQVLLSIHTRDGEPILLRRSVREGELIPFEVGHKQFYLHIIELRNLLTGKDFCVLEISAQLPPPIIPSAALGPQPPPEIPATPASAELDELLASVKSRGGVVCSQLNRLLASGMLSDQDAARAHQTLREHVRIGETFFPISTDEPGERLHVGGIVRTESGRPIPGAVVYAYHTDARGYYSRDGMDESNPRLFDYVRTDENGGYHFWTIRPGHYPDQTEPVEQHIHFTVWADGFPETIARLGFEDDPFWDNQGRQPPAWAMPVWRTDRDGRQDCVFHITLKQQTASGQPSDGPSGLVKIQNDAMRLRSVVKTDWVRQFLNHSLGLPPITTPRKVYFDEARTTFLSEKTHDELPSPGSGTPLQVRELDEDFYYNTRYGSPLAYARPLDVLGQNGLTEIAGKRVLDFGYGTIGHLQLLARLGVDAVGVDVDPLLPALYCDPRDQGRISNAVRDLEGGVTLLNGRWPAQEDVRQSVGEGYDLFISKNTLKNGYIHPEREVDPRKLVQLGVDDEAFVRAVYEILKPGGLVLIYNLCPAPAPPDKPYIPWADGRCPFPRVLWEKVGFRIFAFDQNDDAAARQLGRALGWDQGESAMNLEQDLFALYTIIEKPKAPGT